MKDGQNQTNDNNGDDDSLSLNELQSELDDLSPDDLQDEETFNNVKEKIKSGLKQGQAQKENWREKYQDLKDKRDQNNNNNKNTSKSNEPSGQQDPGNESNNSGKQKDNNNQGVSKVDKIEFRQKYNNLPEDVEEEVFEVAADLGVSPVEAANKEFMQSFINEKTNEADIEDASISKSRNKPSGPSRGKSDWSNASKEDVDKKRRQVMNQS